MEERKLIFIKCKDCLHFDKQYWGCDYSEDMNLSEDVKHICEYFEPLN